MARRDHELVWIGVGPLAAMALGVALIPFRPLTSASNLAFVFLVLTILVAEVGGRAAGLATAVVGALSLNFFLTGPYLTLTIESPDDVGAFIGLAVCGLVAAAFGRRRARSSELLGQARHDLQALQQLAESLATGFPLAESLEGLRRAFRLGGIVLRGTDGRLVAAVPPESAAWPAPAVALEPRTLLGEERQHRLGRRGFRLPDGGGRVRLAGRTEALWLDLWEGGDEGLSVDEHRALGVAVTMLGLALCAAPTPSSRPAT
jgi:hypothetical protein